MSWEHQEGRHPILAGIWSGLWGSLPASRAAQAPCSVHPECEAPGLSAPGLVLGAKQLSKWRDCEGGKRVPGKRTGVKGFLPPVLIPAAFPGPREGNRPGTPRVYLGTGAQESLEIPSPRHVEDCLEPVPGQCSSCMLWWTVDP